MKNKKLIIIPIIILIILLIGVGGFAIIYLKTDMFKSPKELFFKYAGNSFEAAKDFDYDEFLEEYKTVSEKSFKSNGEITAELNTGISEIKDVENIVKKSKINYNLSSIPKEEKSYITIDASYDNKKLTKFEGLSTKDAFGLKNTELYSKYLYIENHDLQALAKKFGINSSTIPNEIKKVDIYDLLYVDKNTRKKIKDTYYDILDKKIDKNNFTQSKDVETTVNGNTLKTNSYSLELTQAETYDIMISLLETLKNDDTTLDLIVEKFEKANVQESFDYRVSFIKSTMNLDEDDFYYNGTNFSDIKFDKDFFKKGIQDEIDQLNNQKQNAKEENKVKLTFYSYKGKTVKFELSTTTNSEVDGTIDIQLTKNKDGKNIISFNIDNECIFKSEYKITNEKGTKKLVGTATINTNSSQIPVSFNIESTKELQKTNIKATLPIEDVLGTSQTIFTEDIVVEFNSETSGELGKGTNINNSYLSISSGEISAKLNFKSDITYTDNLTIEDLSSENGSCLNTMSVSEIETALREVIVNFRKVLPNKLELLGITLPSSDDDTDETDNEADSTTDSDEDDLEESNTEE